MNMFKWLFSWKNKDESVGRKRELDISSESSESDETAKKKRTGPLQRVSTQMISYVARFAYNVEI